MGTSTFPNPAPGSSSHYSRFFPAKGSPQAELLWYRDRLMNRWAALRNMTMARIAINTWYFLGKQWANIDYASAFQGARGLLVRELSEDEFPVRPVTNEVDPSVEQEIISLVKRQWQPKVVPTSNDPAIKAAAQVSNDQLNYRLNGRGQLSWPEKRHELGLHYSITGTGLIYTAWDRTYTDLRVSPAPDAVRCSDPSCPTKLYSRNVPLESLRARPPNIGEGITPVESDDPAEALARLEYCPTCSTPRPLVPYRPDPEEAENADDLYGRPLGVYEPRGATALEVDHPCEFYPENGGYRITPYNMRRWGRRKLRSMEWLEERYPHLVGSLAPDPVHELLYDDPLFGGLATPSMWSPALDSGILDNHKNVDEIVELPTFRHPLGRYVAATRDDILEDDDLLVAQEIDGEEVLVPRVVMSSARFKIRPQEFWGTGLPDHGISLQNRLNDFDAQLITHRKQMGKARIAITPGMWIEGPPVEDPSGAADFIIINPDPANPEMKSLPIQPPIAYPAEAYQERDRNQADIRRIMGPSNASIGQPSGIGTTSGLQLMVEMDEKSRALREEELVNAAKVSWSHLLQLEWVLRVDEDVYRVLGPTKTWKEEKYLGTALRGQHEVDIERAAYIAKSLVQREATREAIADQLIVIDGPVARRKALESYGVDVNINEDSNNQVDHSERIWSDFKDKNTVRVQDPLDDPFIHYTVLGTHLRTEEGERIADEAGWEKIWPIVAGWKLELSEMTRLEQMSINFYRRPLSGLDAAKAYAQAEINYEQQLDLHHRQMAVVAAQRQDPATMAAGVPIVDPVPPMKPPKPVALPQLLQERVFLVWSMMLQRAQWTPPTAGPTEALERDPMIYIRFRALVEAYHLTLTGTLLPPVPPALSVMPGAPGDITGAAAPIPTPGSGATMAPVDKGSSITPPGNGAAGPAGGAGAKPPVTASTAPMPEGGKH